MSTSPWHRAPTQPHEETPTERLDRLLHTAAAPLTGGLSPVSLSLALADWAWHLGVSPGRQMELAALAAQLALDTLRGDEAACRRSRRRSALPPPRLGSLALQRDARGLPQDRDLVARRHAAARA